MARSEVIQVTVARRFRLLLIIPAVFLVSCGDEKIQPTYEGTSYNSPASSEPVTYVTNLFIGSVLADNGSFCTEYRVSGSPHLDRLKSFKSAARGQAAKQKATFQETECSTKNAFGSCKKDASAEGGQVHLQAYFFAPATEQASRQSCDAISGSYKSLN